MFRVWGGFSGDNMTTLVPEEFAPLERQSTAELIAERLRIAIMRGVLAPGAQLGEASLAAQFAVSRGPLREAMQRLVSEGLLRSERNRGIFVIELTDDDVLDVYRSRAAIERAALECIMTGDTVTAYRRLLVPVAVMTEAAARGDVVAVTDADQDFHEVLVDCSGSPRLRRAMRTLLLETRMLLGELQGAYPDLSEQVREHEVLCAAIGAGDAPAAYRLIDEHMHDAVTRLMARRDPASVE